MPHRFLQWLSYFWAPTARGKCSNPMPGVPFGYLSSESYGCWGSNATDATWERWKDFVKPCTVLYTTDASELSSDLYECIYTTPPSLPAHTTNIHHNIRTPSGIKSMLDCRAMSSSAFAIEGNPENLFLCWDWDSFFFQGKTGDIHNYPIHTYTGWYSKLLFECYVLLDRDLVYLLVLYTVAS